MNIFDFEQYIDEVILERGREYFEEHKYSEFNVDGNHYSLIAHGTQDYHVEATLDSFDDIVVSDCNCPYEMGDNCKHEVALFFAIRHCLEEKGNVGVLKEQSDKKPEFDDQLKAMSEKKPKRRTTISDNRFNVILEAGESAETLKVARRIIRFYYQRAREDGFIEYDQAPLAFMGVSFVFETAMVCEEVELGVSLCLLAIEEVYKVGDIDDSYGLISEMLYTGEENLKKLLDENMIKLTKRERKSLFDLLLKHLRKYWGQDLDFSGGALIEKLLQFGHDPDLRSEYDHFLKTLLENLSEKTEAYETEFQIQSIEQLQFKRIFRYGDREELDSFLEQHLKNPNMREYAVTEAIAIENYERALLLIEDGRIQDKDFAGLVDRWDKLAYQVYNKLHQTDEVRNLALKFLLKDEKEYYEPYLGTFPNQERDQAIDGLLSRFEILPHPLEVYVKILIFEKRHEKLMSFCEQNPHRIEKLYPHLLDMHRERVQACFLRWIWDEAGNANNRKEYRRFCNRLKVFKKIFSDAFPALLKEIRETFARRPAMLDELSVLG